MHTSTTSKDFSLGLTNITANAAQQLEAEDVFFALRRHSLGDWGEVGAEDKAENEIALKEGFRLLSVYRDRNGKTFWVITEADRSATTVLLPEDY